MWARVGLVLGLALVVPRVPSLLPLLLVPLLFNRAVDGKWCGRWRLPSGRRVLLCAVSFAALGVGVAYAFDWRGVYPAGAARHGGWALVTLLAVAAAYHFSWEYFFRGFVLTQLAGVRGRTPALCSAAGSQSRASLGRWAIVAQAIPCAIAHVGKPPVELALSFPAALVFGWLAYEESFALAFVAHYALAAAVNVVGVLRG